MRFEFESPWGVTRIGEDLPPHMIAEIGLNHNGSVDLAKRLIESAAVSGAHSVKFQKREVSQLAKGEFLDAEFPKAPYLGSSQRVVRERLEFDGTTFRELALFAQSLGLIFFSSVFDLKSLELVQSLDTRLVKIPSHSITNGPLLDAVATSGLSVIASTGGATLTEIDAAVNRLSGVPLVLMHCVSSYPTPDREMMLGTIETLRDRYRVPIGFSSHEDGILASTAALALGAVAVERHFTLNKAMAGLDHGVSLTGEEFSELADAARRLFAMRGSRGGLLPAEEAARNGYHVGVYASNDLEVGALISSRDLTVQQPAGDPSSFFSGLELDSIIGARLLEKVRKGEQLSRSSVESTR